LECSSKYATQKESADFLFLIDTLKCRKNSKSAAQNAICAFSFWLLWILPHHAAVSYIINSVFEVTLNRCCWLRVVQCSKIPRAVVIRSSLIDTRRMAEMIDYVGWSVASADDCDVWRTASCVYHAAIDQLRVHEIRDDQQKWHTHTHTHTHIHTSDRRWDAIDQKHRLEVAGMAFCSRYTDMSQSNLRGHSLKLNKKRVRLHVAKFSFSNRVVNEWNILDEEIISGCSLADF